MGCARFSWIATRRASKITPPAKVKHPVKMINLLKWGWSMTVKKAPALGVPARVATAYSRKIDPS